jgi:hypothetical protein
MTFTYDASTDIGYIRLKIGDTKDDEGPRPDMHNYSDEEIQTILTKEGSTSNAIAALLEVLANEWAVVPDTTVGPRKESFSQVSSALSKRAKEETESAGQGGVSFVGGFIKRDGYSDDAEVQGV